MKAFIASNHGVTASRQKKTPTDKKDMRCNMVLRCKLGKHPVSLHLHTLRDKNA